jgi:hypothetical protein
MGRKWRMKNRKIRRRRGEGNGEEEITKVT